MRRNGGIVMKRRRKKFVSIKDIAKATGTSITTVSFALNLPDRVSVNTRRTVLRVAREMGYSRVKKHNTLGCIGIIADDNYNLIHGEFYSWVVFGMLEELKKRGIDILIDSTGKNPDYLPKMITKDIVDGVLLLGKSSLDLLYLSEQKNIPILLVGHPIPGQEMHSIVPDGRAGAMQIVDHLISLGHKKIAMIIGEPMHDPTTSERVEGYRYSLSKANIEFKESYLREADFGKPETAVEAATNILEMTDPPTAIFCASDSLAYRAYKAVKAKGLRIPEDISIAGFDDISAPEYALLPQPELTTVHVDRVQMGKTSVEILFDLIQNPAKVVSRYTLPVKLAIKKSTGKPKG